MTDVACTVCGCVCDDLVVHVEGERLGDVERACPLAEPWFAALRECGAGQHFLGDRETDFPAAVAAAADILRRSDAPLIYGLSRSSTAGQRAAVKLADRLGGVIDTTASVCHGPSIMAIQEAGEATCSLGEVRQRADLVLFWGANPAVSHPRHLERYSGEPVSEFLPNGRADRRIVVIDSQSTATAELADEFVQVEAGRDFELIWALRLALRGDWLPAGTWGGVDSKAVRRLASRLVDCRYGVVFFGLGLAQSRLGHRTVEALLRLVADLNAQTRFSARRLRIPGDVTGADSVLCWQTGFAFGVDLRRGWPRYNPGEYTANELLERREVDAALIIGSESLSGFSPAALYTLRGLPTIVLDSPHVRPAIDAAVRFTTAVYGVHAAGTAYRMDEIPIPLRALCASDLPTDDQVLAALLDALPRRAASAVVHPG
ncbi:MAG: formylmethanofuran dehydrogenase subunit B [Planctomyces sp.]|nr:formylmethanofuran dehydrogenase subunit B [Planctomyces sp.]